MQQLHSWFECGTGGLIDSNDGKHHPYAERSAMLALCDDAMWCGAKVLGLSLPRSRK